MDNLTKLEQHSIYILREAAASVDHLAALWSFGKDSNVMIHLMRKAFFGRVPFPLIHCDTELEFDEVYDFRDRYAAEWNINLISEICPPLEATDPNLPPDTRVAARKTLGLKNIHERLGLRGVITGIRRDEEATRAKERIFSPRSDDASWDVQHQPPELWDYFMLTPPPSGSLRIHPLLCWSERDIWNYIKRENIPLVSLYFAKPYGKLENRDFGGEMMRFRSIGERGITWPTPSTAATIDEVIAELKATIEPERSGRPMGGDTDSASFEKLRAAGYM